MMKLMGYWMLSVLPCIILAILLSLYMITKENITRENIYFEKIINNNMRIFINLWLLTGFLMIGLKLAFGIE